MYRSLILVLTLCLSQSLQAGSAESLKLKTPRGVEIEVSIDLPAAATGKHPAIIIAPGQGYHKDLPLVKNLAEKTAANGFVAIRFNWNYFSADSQNGQPSDDLKNEIEDMQTVINFAKGDQRIDGSRLIIAGKSLGTFVSYSIFDQDDSFAGLILMTPICTDPKSGAPIGDESYPRFAAKTKPIALVLGNADGLCSLPALYDFVKSSKGNVSISAFGGGHSLNFPKTEDAAKDAARNEANVAAAVHAAAQWANIIAGN